MKKPLAAKLKKKRGKKTQETKLKKKGSKRTKPAPTTTILKRFTDEDRAVLARLAVDVWRMQQRQENEAWVGQLVERFTDSLRELDVEIIDLVGTQFIDGDTVEVLHNEAREGWKGPLTVTRVIRPTVRVGDHKMQGQVVVGDGRSTD